MTCCEVKPKRHSKSVELYLVIYLQQITTDEIPKYKFNTTVAEPCRQNCN